MSLERKFFDKDIDLESLFPNQIKVYEIEKLQTLVPTNNFSLPHQNFAEPLSDEIFGKLVIQIAEFLNNNKTQIVYHFFYRATNDGPKDSGWVVMSAILKKSETRLPKEIVFSSYSIDLMYDIKNRLYRELENEVVFQDNIYKMSSLTKREKEIVIILSSGKNSHEIANTLIVSIQIIKTHRKSIYEKLAIHNFAGLFRIAKVFDFIKTDKKLDETQWKKQHFKKFCVLTRREKEIIVLLVHGKNSAEISDSLNICRLTVNTHRRNINEKMEITSFSGLYKFASVYGLID